MAMMNSNTFCQNDMVRVMARQHPEVAVTEGVSTFLIHCLSESLRRSHMLAYVCLNSGRIEEEEQLRINRDAHYAGMSSHTRISSGYRISSKTRNTSHQLPMLFNAVRYEVTSLDGLKVDQSPKGTGVTSGGIETIPGEELEEEWDAIALNYTSGTTSDPKGVVYSHCGAFLSTMSLIQGWEMGSEVAYLWSLPMFQCTLIPYDSGGSSKC
ncbi:AMP-binding, conserved site-containing protein [Artemisia annua]|uniref:AMP-binding, conserved site-containing protein n=1 Tax=Artemisia annua TaxID=35608 RepID=A0A2U1KPF5_ARTAN|nr:AMP-binding, conserved site-containing protein [Artemisia annua]